MKKLLVISLLCIGCTATVSTDTRKISGCTYVVASNSKGVGIVHAGDCSNPIHQHNYFRTPDTAFGKMSTENDGEYPRILPPTFKARIKGDEPEIAYKYQDTTYIGYVSGIIRENIVLRQRLKKIQKQKSTEYIIEIDTFPPQRPDLLHREPAPYTGRGRMLPEWIHIGDTFIKQ